MTCLLEDLESEKSCEVLDKMSKVRDIIVDPANVVLYFAGGLDQLKSPVNPIKDFLPEDLMGKKKQQRLVRSELIMLYGKGGMANHPAYFSLTVIPDWKLLNSVINEKPSCIVGMGCLESSFFYQITPSVTSFSDPDVPALMVYLQYLIQAEVRN